MFFDVSIKYLFYNMISELKDQYKLLNFFYVFFIETEKISLEANKMFWRQKFNLI